MKKISYIAFTLLLFLSFRLSALAASLSIWSNVSSAKVGQTVTISVKADGLAGRFSITSSDGNVLAGGSSSEWLENNTYTYTFTAKSAGTVTVTVTAINASDLTENANSFTGSKSVSVTVVKEATNTAPPSSNNKPSQGSSGGTTSDKKTYSSNNNLKSLEVEGYTLSETFSKDLLEYTLEVPNDTEKITVKAEAEDSKAKVGGIGEIQVSEGANRIEIKVTAENGNEKIYIINITVKELDSIEVTVNGKKYTIIRKEGVLEPPENYEKSSIKIGKENVLCYQNAVTGNILIGLKDEKGNSKYFLYDKKKDAYSAYNSYKIGGVNFNILPMPSDVLPEDYRKVTFSYDNNKLDGYQYYDKNVTYAADDSVKASDFYLIYGVNELSGVKGLYVYDKLEGTIQRYNSDVVLTYQNRANNYFLYLLISLAVLSLTIITFTIALIKKSSHRNKFA